MLHTLRVEHVERGSSKNYFRLIAFKIDFFNPLTRIDFQLFLLIRITQSFEVYYGAGWEIGENLIVFLDCTCATVAKITFPH